MRIFWCFKLRWRLRLKGLLLDDYVMFNIAKWHLYLAHWLISTDFQESTTIITFLFIYNAATLRADLPLKWVDYIKSHVFPFLCTAKLYMHWKFKNSSSTREIFLNLFDNSTFLIFTDRHIIIKTLDVSLYNIVAYSFQENLHVSLTSTPFRRSLKVIKCFMLCAPRVKFVYVCIPYIFDGCVCLLLIHSYTRISKWLHIY